MSPADADGNNYYAVWVCPICRSQGDPDGNWGCEHSRWSGRGLVEVVVPNELIDKALGPPSEDP